MPTFFSIVRRHSSSTALKTPNFLLRRLVLFSANSSPACEKFLSYLETDDANVEKHLHKVKAKLDSRCVIQVLERCAIDRPQIGLRFFIWAALHPTHKHTSYMYNEACKSLGVEQNPRLIMDLINRYRDEGFAVSAKMFKVVLSLCRAAKDHDLGLWVLRKMKEFNIRPDTVSYNVVIGLLVEKGQMDEAIGLMKEMGLIDIFPDMVTYVSIIKGLCDCGRLEDAFGLIKIMEGHGCVPNTVICSMILDGFCGQGNLEMALEFLGRMEKEDGACRPNVVTYTTMIKGFVEKGKALEAMRILDKMDHSGVKQNQVTFATLLDGLCKQNCVEEARKVVDKFGGGNFPSDELYSLLVLSILRAGKHEESESTFKMMVAHGLRPSGLASSSILKQIISEGRILDALSLFDVLGKSGNLLHIDPLVYSILLLGLCQGNHVAEAATIIRIMVEGRIRLKSCHVGTIIKHLNNLGEYDLASNISRISS